MAEIKKRNRAEYKYFACDFETTVYEGQDKTEVWASSLCELWTENVIVHHSIGDTMLFFENLCENYNIISYYHNLKFDGMFILSWLLNNKRFKESSYTVKDGERDCHIWEKRTQMPRYSYQYTISGKGQWYSIIIKFKKNKWEIRDSLKLLPFTLKQLGASFKTKHQKKEMEYEGERYAGCNISGAEMEYIKNDVLVLKEALEIMFEQGHKKITIGSCCLSEYKSIFTNTLFKQLFPSLDEISIDTDLHQYPNADKWIRKSYRGGWCYVVKGKENRVLRNGFTIDVNSLYPSVMTSDSGNRYPIGIPTWWTGDYIPPEAKAKNKYFFIHIKTRFYLKKGYLPFIQIKNNLMYNPRENLESSDYYDKKTKRYYKYYINETGIVQPAIADLYLTMTDFALMQEHYNLVDCQIIDGCYFNSELNLFDDYINKYKCIKMQSKGAVRQIAKLFLNNLYGKMATSPDSSYQIAYLKPDGSIGFYTQLEELRKTVYVAVGCAVTSYARNFTIRVAQQNFYGANKGGFAYADTDSCHIDDMSITNLKGVQLHDTNFLCWKCESCWDKGIFARQKTYIEHITHEDLKKCKPYYNVKCAGMPEVCKKLLVASIDDIPLTSKRIQALCNYNPHKFSKSAQAKVDFLMTKRDLTDFKVGLQIPGKLVPRAIKGGVVLQEGYYTMTNLR